MKLQSRPPVTETLPYEQIENMAVKTGQFFPATVARHRVRGLLSGLKLLGHVESYTVDSFTPDLIKVYVDLPTGSPESPVTTHSFVIHVRYD